MKCYIFIIQKQLNFTCQVFFYKGFIVHLHLFQNASVRKNTILPDALAGNHQNRIYSDVVSL